MSHTPGPWELGAAGNCNVVSFNGDDIAGVARCGEHNARLIAAAPEMLHRLEEASRFLFEEIGDLLTGDQMEDYGVYGIIEFINKTISKAKGE